MDQFTLLLIVVAIFGIWIFNSLNVLREYERGVIFRIGRLLPEPKGPGLDLGALADRPHRSREPPDDHDGRPDAGRHH